MQRIRILRAGSLTRLVVLVLMSIILILTMVLTGCSQASPSPQQKTMDTVLFRWTYVLQGQIAPIYLGIDKGYFLQENIIMNLLAGTGSTQNLQLLGAGQMQIGAVDAAVTMTGISQGIPLKIVFTSEQQCPFAIISPKSKPITDPKQLAGKTVGVSTTGAETAMFPILAAKVGLDPKSVNLVSSDAGVRDTGMAQGKFDAILAWYTTTPTALKAMGFDSYSVKYSDYGITLLSKAVVVNTKLIQENPDFIKRFIRAYSKSWEDGVQHPAESMDAFMKYEPRAKREDETAMMEQTFAVLHTKNTEGKKIGWMAKEDVEATQTVLMAQGNIKTALPIDTYYTNEFIPQ